MLTFHKFLVLASPMDFIPVRCFLFMANSEGKFPDKGLNFITDNQIFGFVQVD
jgi:hypothetical protein